MARAGVRSSLEPSNETVAIVIPCYRQAQFLPTAIESAKRQSIAPSEVIVVDDGPDDEVAAVAQSYPAVRLIRQPNRGLAGARNSGLREAAAAKIIFLDADDVLLPGAIGAGLKCFRTNPDAAFVYGGFWERRGRSRSRKFSAISSHRDLVQCNWIGMIATVMFDRAKLLQQGCFDESLAMCEDWEAYLRLSRRFPFAAHGTIVAEYVKHESNASNNLHELWKWIEVVRTREWGKGLDEDGQRAWHEGEQMCRATLDPDQPVARGLVQRAVGKAARLLRLVKSK